MIGDEGVWVEGGSVFGLRIEIHYQLGIYVAVVSAK